jgi:hypothetical protein
MGRKQINHEAMSARFPLGMLARMKAVLDTREKKSDLVRTAVEREIARREQKRPARAAACRARTTADSGLA